MSDKIKIDTLIVSDIHLGLDLSRPKKMLEAVDRYDFEKLILNGDIFDSFNFKRLHSEHWDVLSRLREISKKGKVVWVNGNHDGPVGPLASLLGVKVYSKYVWRSNNKKFIAIHGHQFDRFLHKNIFISKVAIFIYKIIQRFDTKSKVIFHWVQNNNKRWLRMSKAVMKGAFLYAKLNRADYIFCGHTHISKHTVSGKINYYNSGSLTASPSSYITIKDEEIKIIEVE